MTNFEPAQKENVINLRRWQPRRILGGKAIHAKAVIFGTSGCFSVEVRRINNSERAT